MAKAKILVFASGSATGGGSGFENLVKSTDTGILDAQIVGVVSNHKEGGVRERASKLMIPFIHFPAPWGANEYWRIAKESGAQYFALSGWLKQVVGLDTRYTFNIHPGPLPEFGGKGMHGHHVHEAVMAAYAAGRVTESAVTMHFVTEEYDRGPVFFRCHVPISRSDTPESLAARVNAFEHEWQPAITNMVVNGQISWNGVNHSSLQVPQGYAKDHYPA